jgi:hypothetical protein
VNHSGKPYIVTRMHQNGRRHEKWVALDDRDLNVVTAALNVKLDLDDAIVEYPCTNMHCRNTVKMTKKQVEEICHLSMKRYQIINFPFCSAACRGEVLAQFGEMALEQ